MCGPDAKAAAERRDETFAERDARCRREHRDAWRVSAFNGYHYGCVCTRCGRYWRTKAAYVDQLPDIEAEGYTALRRTDTPAE